MKIDKEKLARQHQVIDKWKANRACGSLEAVTGFGKTYVALLIIADMNSRKPERTTQVVVPTHYLKKQWTGKIKEMKLRNVKVGTINTLVKSRSSCDLLILDEIHNYASTTFKKVFSVIGYKFILGLTATMERMDNKHTLINHHCPIIDTIDMKEALANGYVSDFRVFNLGIEMNEEDALTYRKIGDKFHKFFAMFGRDFDTAMRCLSDPSYCTLYAKRMGWTPEETKIFAINFNRNMQLRKKFLYYAPSKVDKAVELIERFKVPAITFSQTTDFCDSIYERLPKLCVTYHSKMGAKAKKEAIRRFQDKRTSVRVINTARALDEGFDIAGVEMGIICSGTSSPRQDLQRTGRAIRYAEDKLGMIINLYIKNTQDEKWLKARQKQTQNVLYVDSIEEIEEIINELKPVT